MRLASYNVENLFARPRAMNLDDPAQGTAVLDAYAKLNGLIAEPAYDPVAKQAMLALLDQLGLLDGDGPFAILRENRERLLGRVDGRLAIIAEGRADWIGWIELKTEPVLATAIENTGRVVRDVAADVIAVVEAESRPSLLRFSELVLPRVGGTPYPHVMLIDGNDDRGIDLGLMTGGAFPIASQVSHVDDRDGRGERIFSRDCPEYEVRLPGGGSLWLLVNHFKSKRGRPAESDAKRLSQARRVREIYDARRAAGAELVAVLGDLNDTPERPPLAPLLAPGSGLVDVMALPGFIGDGRPGTYANGTKGTKIDYILLSPPLRERFRGGGVNRTGVWGGKNGTLFPHLPELTRAAEAASDHAALWAELDVE